MNYWWSLFKSFRTPDIREYYDNLRGSEKEKVYLNDLTIQP